MIEGTVSRRSLLAITALMAAVVFLCLGSAHARAESKPFHIDFDSSNIQLGTVGDLPLDDLTAGASINGTIDDGVVTIPVDGFKFPELGITDPVTIKGFMALDGPATGTFDATTGDLELDAKAGIYASVDIKALIATLETAGVDVDGLLSSAIGTSLPFSPDLILGFIPTLTCGFTGMDVHFTTGTTAPTSLATGAPFTKGATGPGALATEWSQLGTFGGKTQIPILGDACVLIKGLLPDLLGGLTGDTGDTGDTGTGLPDLGGIDLGGLDLTSLLADLDNPDLGPSALTLTRTADTPPSDDTTTPPDDKTSPPPDVRPSKPARLKLKATPKKRSVKRGKSVKYKVTVSNTGSDSASGVKVCVKVPKKALVTKRCKALGGIAGGKSKHGAFKVKVKHKAGKRSYKVKFKAAAKSVKAANSSVRLLAR